MANFTQSNDNCVTVHNNVLKSRCQHQCTQQLVCEVRVFFV